jgi:TPR repeat protein
MVGFVAVFSANTAVASPIDPPEERHLLCEKGDFSECRSLGEDYEFGRRGITQNIDKAFELYTKACNGGFSDGCSDLAWMYSRGKGVELNHGKEMEFLIKACNLLNGSACNGVGDIYRAKYGSIHGLPMDKFRALPYFVKACDLKEAFACLNAGEMYDNGEGTRMDKNVALEYFGRACDLKLEDGCREYARIKKTMY